MTETLDSSPCSTTTTTTITPTTTMTMMTDDGVQPATPEDGNADEDSHVGAAGDHTDDRDGRGRVAGDSGMHAYADDDGNTSPHVGVERRAEGDDDIDMTGNTDAGGPASVSALCGAVCDGNAGTADDGDADTARDGDVGTVGEPDAGTAARGDADAVGDGDASTVGDGNAGAVGEGDASSTVGDAQVAGSRRKQKPVTLTLVETRAIFSRISPVWAAIKGTAATHSLSRFIVRCTSFAVAR